MRSRRKTGAIKMIERIRKTPLSHRRRIAFVSSLTITLLIASVWATVIFPQTFSMNSGRDMAADSSAPFEQVFDDATIIFDDMRSGFAEIRERSSGIFSDSPPEVGPMNEDTDAVEDQQSELPPRNSAAGEGSTGNDSTEGLEEGHTSTNSETEKTETSPADEAEADQESESQDEDRTTVEE